jgi:hypothetical protein
MTDIVEKLPYELANIVYSYLGKSDTAKMIEEYHTMRFKTLEHCKKCKNYIDILRNHYCCDNVRQVKKIICKINCKNKTKPNHFMSICLCVYPIKYKSRLCEYCYAEELGEIIYTCIGCNKKTFTLGEFNNTEADKLFCNYYCYEDYLIELEEEDLEEEDLEEDVYTCKTCNQKTYTFGEFNNIEEGLFCDDCFDDYLEELEEEDLENLESRWGFKN